MKRKLLLGFWLLFLSFCSLAFAAYAPGEIVVRFKPGVIRLPQGMSSAKAAATSVSAASVQALAAKHQVKSFKKLYRKSLENRPDWTHLEDYYVISFPKTRKVKEVAKDYQDNDNVVSASANFIFKAFDTTPDDPRFIDQYGLTNIRAPQAWDRTTGSPEVIIAVLDTGIDTDHEDFTGRLAPQGYDFVNDDNNPEDDYGHGTAVAGVIGATTNNAKGVAGVDWQAKLLILKVLDNNGEGLMTDILSGISYANSLGADIINMSFGQYNSGTNKYVEENPAGLRERCLAAYNNGVILVAAAGNGGVDWYTYPAYYPTVMAVAAVDSSDQRSIWSGFDPSTGNQPASNYGDWIDVAAPGSNIWSTKMGGDYGLNNGTSLACPFVAGLAGLIKAANPTLSNQEIMDIIADSADNIDSLNPGYEGKLGSGRINAYRSVSGTIAEISSLSDGDYIKGLVDIYGTAGGWGFSNYILDILQSDIVVTTITSSTTTVEGGKLGTWQTQGFNGQYTVRLRAFTSGSITEETSLNVIVDNVSPEAEILALADGATVEGAVTIFGSAKDQYFEYYLLEYGSGLTPIVFERVEQSYLPVDNNFLATWETSGLEGIFTVRLTAYDKAGGARERKVWLNVDSSYAFVKKASPQAGLPLTYVLPNPFNRQTATQATFNYSLPTNFATRIYLFDLAGTLVWQSSYLPGENGGKSGENNPAWSGRDQTGQNVPSGVYLYQIITDSKVLARGKLIVHN